MPEYGPDGQEKKKLTPFEQYYENLEHPPADSKLSAAKDEILLGLRKGSESWDAFAVHDGSGLPGTSSQREQELKKLFESDAGVSPFSANRGTFSDIFGVGDNTLSREDALKHKAYLDEYHAILDPGWKAPADSFSPLNGALEAARPTFKPVGALDGVASSSRHEAGSSFSGMAIPSLNPASLPNVGVKVENPVTVAPTPRKKVRRGRYFLVRNMRSVSSYSTGLPFGAGLFSLSS